MRRSLTPLSLIGMHRFLTRLCALLLAASAGGVRAQGAAEGTLVEVPSLDQRADGSAVPLRGHWFAAAASALTPASTPAATSSATSVVTGAATSAAPPAAMAAPAVVLLHGCAGAYASSGKLNPRLRDYARALNAEGWHALVIDSLQSRGSGELCTQKLGTRAVTQTQRRRDALGALAWLAARPDVKADKLALLGWSNGGSTVLASTNRRHPEVRAALVRPALAVAFYPGCEADLKAGYEASAPLLLLVGEADDWTPAAPCMALAQQSGAEIESYPGAVHGFDANTPVRHRADVPGGVNPGRGVHVGANPAAREASRKRMLEFMRAKLR